MKFAKLFELEDGEQVLLTTSYDDESDEYKINITTDFDTHRVEVGIGFKEEESQMKFLENYSLENAKKIRRKFQIKE